MFSCRESADIKQGAVHIFMLTPVDCGILGHWILANHKNILFKFITRISVLFLYEKKNGIFMWTMFVKS